MTTRNLVGIGTTDPQYTLDVAGDLNITGGLFTNGQNASGALYWSETAADNIVASTNVGIGITGEPVAPLHVGGDARIDGNLTVNGTQTVINTNVEETSRIEVINNGTGPAMVVNQTGAQPVADFQDDGVSAFFIADGGNVGIGITNPAGKFNVAISGPTSFTNQLEGTIAFGNATSGVGAIMPTIQAKSNGGTDRIGLNLQSGTTDANSNPDMRFNVRTSTNTDFATLTSRAFDFTRFTTPLMTILRNGNVGIGTTDPTQILHVANGGIFVQKGSTNSASDSAVAQADSALTIYGNSVIDSDTTSQRMLFLHQPNGSAQRKGSGFSISLSKYIFTTNNFPATRVDFQLPPRNIDSALPSLNVMSLMDTGNVGIGTTDPAEKLHVQGNARVNNLLIDTTPTQTRIGHDGSGLNDLLVYSRGNVEIAIDSNDSSDTRAFIVSHNAEGGGSELMRVQENGNVGIGVTNPVSRFQVFTPSVSGTSPTTRTAFGSSAANQMDVTNATSSSEIVLDNHINATLISDSAITYTQASTVRINGPPIAGTNVTFTNTASLNVVLGDIKHNGAVWAAPAGTAPLYSARAWVIFNGSTTGTNPAPMTILNSGNVSSITRNGTGLFTVTFTVPMPTTNFGFSITGGNASSDGGTITGALRTDIARVGTSISVAFGAGAKANPPVASVIVFA